MSTQIQSQQQLSSAMAVPPQQTIYIPVQVSGGTTVGNLAARTCLALGICQLIIGVILFLLGIISIIFTVALYFIGSPIWCGIFFIVTGCLGIGASRTKTKGLIIATLVCSIISASIAGGYLLPISITMACFEYQWYDYEYDHEGARIGLDSVVAIFALAECVLAIIHSVICCRAVCCGQQSEMPVYYQVAGQPVAAMQPMQPMPAFAGAQGTAFLIPQGVHTSQNTGQYHNTGLPAAQPQPYISQGQGYNPQPQPQAQQFDT